MRIRQFLGHSGESTQGPLAKGLHVLVVIDHHEARVYGTELAGSVPIRFDGRDTAVA